MSKYLQKTVSQWQDAGNLILGVWLFLTPWIFGYASAGAPAMNAFLVGAIIALLAAGALYAYHQWEEWLNVVLAIWLIVSPWVLGFASMQAAMINALVVGLLVLSFALWAASIEHPEGRRTA